jgi:hypothetical protein
MARRNADERLDIVLKHSLQDEAVINEKQQNLSMRLIEISGNIDVVIKHFAVLSEKERH